MQRGTVWSLGALTVLLAVLVTGCLVPPTVPGPSGPPGPVPTVGCDRAAEHLVLTTSVRLDARCAYTGGIEISTSGVTLDCRGAHVSAPPVDPWPWGVLVHADASVPLHDITVRNCTVSGFATDVMVRRDGAEELDEAHQYDTPFDRIRIEDNRILDATRDGIYLEWGVTGTAIRRNEVAGSAAVGLYFNPGATRNVVEGNRFHGNGFGDVRPDGLPFDLGGVTFRYLSTGREAIAIDGAYGNLIRDNDIRGNSSGGIFLYRNCGEYSTVNRRWWGSDRNLIVGNRIEDEAYGVWVASRQAENQWFMECADPAYVEGPYRRVHLDHAEGNAIRANTFVEVGTGVRVEDDGNRIEGNRFRSSTATDQAVVLGTQLRTEVLGRPVADTVVQANDAAIAGNDQPFVWAYGQAGTIDRANRSGGRPSSVVAGTAPALGPFLFVVRVWI